jgi:tetratricopeptide (TPR) repeat protein
MKLTTFVILVIVLVGFADTLPAQALEELFSKGNMHYQEGRFQEAVQAYETILGRGVASAQLYYNLGNAYYRMNDVGRAILAFERAFRLNPSDPDIQHNRSLANLRTVDRIEPLPELFYKRWLRALSSSVSPSLSVGAAVVGWMFLFASLAAFLLLPHHRLRSVLRWSIALSSVVVLTCGSIAALQALERSARDEAILLAPVVTAKTSPDDRSVDAFVIHEGVKVRMEDRVEDWVRITLPDGKVGWIKADQCELI